MPNISSQEILNLSAPAILIVWVLREVFSYLVKMQTLKKESCETPTINPNELLPVLTLLANNLQKQTEVLQQIHLELRENSVRLRNVADDISQLANH